MNKIFVGAKNNDYIVQLVESKAEVCENYQRYIPIFKDPFEFFKYFKVDSFEGTILIKINPKNLFTEIDNYRFEKSIKELIQNYESFMFYKYK